MKKRLIILTVLVVALMCALAITASAASYDTTRKVKLDNNTEVALYDADGNALTWYYDGGELVSEKTVDVINVNGTGWITYKSTVSASNVVVANFQDPDYASKVTYKVSGLNISFRHSTSLEYVFLGDEIKNFNGTYYFSNCDKLKVFEITENSQITSFAQYTFYDCAVLKEIYIPSGVTALPTSNDGKIGFLSMCPMLDTIIFADDIKLTSIGATAFRGCTALTSIDLPDGLTEIQANAFNGCTNLTGVKIPDSVTTLGENAFRSTGIVDSPFSATSRCTTWGKYVFRDCDSLKNFIVPRSLTETPGDQGYGPFSECEGIDIVTFGTYGEMTNLPSLIFALSNIKEIILPEELVSIGARAFYYTSGLEEIIIPNSVETIGERAFQSCTSLEKIVFGNSLKYIYNTGTDHNSLTYGSPLKEIYLPASFYATAPATDYKVSYVFQGSSGNTLYFYTGSQEQLATAIINFKACTGSNDNNGNFLNATQVSYDDYISNTAAYEKGKYIIYGYNACDAFYNGVHAEDNNPCVINCSQCNTYGESEKNPVHNIVATIVYANGYDNAGLKTTGCSNEGCTHGTSESSSALFTCLGYSTQQYDGLGVTIGYSVNNNAIKEYKEITGNDVSYGLFLAAEEKLGGADIFDSEGKVASGAVVAEMPEDTFLTIEIKVNGLENYKDKTFAIGAYVAIEADGEKNYSYLQDGTPADGDKYFFATYDDIAKIVKNK